MIAFTVLIGIIAIFHYGQAQTIRRNVVGIITVDNGNPNKGEWTINEFCPHETYATGFSLLVEENQGTFGDDTALNGLRLTCGSRTPVEGWYYGVAEAYNGEWGTWRSQFDCPADLYITMFRARVEDPGLFDDDTGVNNLDFYCGVFEDPTAEGYMLLGDGMDRGRWGDWSNSCPPYSAVCGFEQLYHGPEVGGNSATNDLMFYCCDD